MTLPQVILIPGLLNDAELWRDQIDGLADVAMPLVADITRGESLPALAETILGQAEPRFALVGFSLGGIVALEIMKLAPERVTHLGLLDTTMLPDTPERAKERAHLITMARNPGKFHGFGEKLLETYLAPQNRKDTKIIERVRGMTLRLGSDVFIRQSLVERPDNRQILRDIHCPTLVLCGLHDALTPPELHQDMARAIAGAQLLILPESGHLTPMEQPDDVTGSLRDLIARD